MRLSKFISAILILSMVFTLGMSTGHTAFAVTITGSIAGFSALLYLSPKLNNMAYNAIVIPNFTAKTDAEIKDLSEDDLMAYKKLEKEFEVASMKKYFMDEMTAQLKAGGNSEEIAKMTASLETITKEHIEWGLELKAKNEQENKTFKTLESTVHTWIADNIDEIKQIQRAKSGTIELEMKAVADITTASASLPVAAPAIVGVQDAPPANINFRGTLWQSLVTTINTNLAAYPYTESTPKEGDAAYTAEGIAKSQVDFKIETRWATPVKLAAYEILTDESVQDIPGLQSIATGFLRSKHDLKKEQGIFFGDGISPNPQGATVYGRTFVGGGMTNTIAAPNIMDVINACITDIYTTHNFQDEIPYMANLAMLNPVDFFVQFVAAKDGNGLPLYPTASLFNRVTLGGVTIMPYEEIPLGQLFVADMSKYNVTDYISYTVQIGWINDQLITNKFTMVGESRFHAFVKNLDEQAFIYDYIAVVKNTLDPLS